MSDVLVWIRKSFSLVPAFACCLYIVWSCIDQELLAKFWPSSSKVTMAAAAVRTAGNARLMRDIKAREGVLAHEVARRAYLYVARNQSLPSQVRHQAQLQLNTFDKYTRPSSVKNRCSETGRGRGILSEFALCRVSLSSRCFCFEPALILRFSTNSG